MAFKNLTIQIRVIQKVRRELAAAREALAQFDKEVRGIQGGRVSQGGAQYNDVSKGAEKAAKAQEKLNKVNKKSAKTFAVLEESAKKSNKQIKHIPKTAEQADKSLNKLGQASRWTAEGFLAMIKSQAAWLAGFAIIFGTISAFIGLLTEAVNIQNEWARSVRVLTGYGRDSIGDLGEAYSALTVQMLRTGSTAKDINEVLYQLGSAGLSTKEAVAALESTMNTLIGTEGDTTQITKLVAGVYNNMKDQIYAGADGVVRFSTDLKTLHDPMNKQISLTEKMVAINDALVWTWKDNQVEMDEINNGLKYAIATSNAAGISLTELLSVLAVLNNRLIKSGIAGRSFQSMMSRIARKSQKFAKAFDIKIDPNKPLDLIDILEQVKAKMSEGNLTAAELGKTFNNLGLRGAKTFITLVRNVEELKQRMDDFSVAAKGSSEQLFKIIQATPEKTFARARQAMVKLVDLLTRGLVIAVVGAVKAFNLLAEALFKLDKAMGGVLGMTTQVVAFVVAMGGLALVVKLLYGALVALAGVLGLTLGALAAWIAVIVASIAIVAALVFGFKKLIDYVFRSKKATDESTTAKEKWVAMSKKEQDELSKIVMKAAELIATYDELSGINLSKNIEDYIGSASGIDVINKHIQDSLFYRKATLGEIQAINNDILGKAKDERDDALLGLTQMDLQKAKQEDIKANIDAMVKATENYNTKLEQSVQQMGDIYSLTNQIATFDLELEFGDKLIEEVRRGTGGASAIMKDFYNEVDQLSIEKISGIGLQIESMFSKFKTGDVSFKQFRTLWNEYANAAKGAITKTNENISKLNSSIDEHKTKIHDLVLEYSTMGAATAKSLQGINDIFGLGVSAAEAAISSIEQNKQSIAGLEEEFRKGTAALNDLVNAGAGYDKINEAQLKLYATESKLVDLESKNSAAREKKTAILERNAALLEQEAGSLEGSLFIAKRYGDQMRALADDAKAPVEARIKALANEKKYLEDQEKFTVDSAKNKNAQIKNLLNQGVIDEYQALQLQKEARDKYYSEISRLEEAKGKNSKDAINAEFDLSVKQIAEQEKQIENLNKLMGTYSSLKKMIEKKIGANAFEPLSSSAKIALEKVLNIEGALDRLDGRVVNVTVEQTTNTAPPVAKARQFGGLVNGSLFARVSSGEGFIPPDVARRNMGALSALNQGSVTPSAKKLGGISRFDGPSGIDNIKTTLPAGGFVISRKGMQAYDNAVSDRERFQMGGFVGGTDGVTPTAEENQQSTSRFDLVLKVDGEEQRYPLFGQKEIIDELSTQLEKRNLTRL